MFVLSKTKRKAIMILIYTYSFEALEYGDLHMYGEVDLSLSFTNSEVTEIKAESFEDNAIRGKPTALDGNEFSVDYNTDDFVKFIVREFNARITTDTKLYNAVKEKLTEECNGDTLL